MNDKVLLSIEGKDTQAGEFIRMYNKSSIPGKSEDVNSYLNDFIVFKLKVRDAINEGYDTTRAFKNELKGYRNQLAQNYLTDTKTREEILQKAYKRYLTEINAWHILIALPQEASPEDTLNAWKKALDIRERINTEESFEQVARGTSDDKSVMVNGGNLGFFTVFQMIMPFEEAAFNLKEGAVSMPVRTPYGYHIIKVTKKRPTEGKVRVAHIMKSAAPGADDEDLKNAETEINAIYNQLQNGESFAGLAKTKSDHKESAPKGGELNWFGTGEIVSTFSEAAFALKDTGNYTKPIRTIYGWHIIKLLDRKEPGTFEETRAYLESKISQSYLNSISKKLFVDKLKKEYDFKLNESAFNWFVSNTDTAIIKGLMKYNRNNIPKGYIYTFANQKITARDFADYIENRGAIITTRDSLEFIRRTLETNVSDHIIAYENSILETKYPEFRYLINEFHDGILLFEISAKKIWNKITEDSVGLHQYYEANKEKFLTPKSIEGKLYVLNVQGGEKTLLRAYKKQSRKHDGDGMIKEKFNKNEELLSIKEGVWITGDDAEIDKLRWQKGYQTLNKNGLPAILSVTKVNEPIPRTYKEVQGEMMTGYQEYLEKIWIEQLKERYTVKIDSVVLDEVKKKLSNE